MAAAPEAPVAAARSDTWPERLRLPLELLELALRDIEGRDEGQELTPGVRSTLRVDAVRLLSIAGDKRLPASFFQAGSGSSFGGDAPVFRRSASSLAPPPSQAINPCEDASPELPSVKVSAMRSYESNEDMGPEGSSKNLLGPTHLSAGEASQGALGPTQSAVVPKGNSAIAVAEKSPLGGRDPTHSVATSRCSKSKPTQSAAPSKGSRSQRLKKMASYAPNLGSALAKEQQAARARVRRLSELFTRLDLDNSGSIGYDELATTLKATGFSKKEIVTFMRKADTSGDGLIHRDEFIRALEIPSQNLGLTDQALDAIDDRIVLRNRWMIPQASMFRLWWDTLCSILLTYIAITEPMVLAFPALMGEAASTVLDLAVNIFFLCDVVLNFRTGYYTADGFEVLDPWLVAKKYLQGWFLLDTLSSLPFDAMTAGNVDNLQPLRLLKTGKVMKVLKIMRLNRALKLARNSDVVNDFNDLLREAGLAKFIPLVRVTGLMAFLTHWLACFMAVSGYGYFESQQDVNDIATMYAAALYWAMTTISTVGYGDLTPTNTVERMYSMIAMIIGGTFYGYVIGRITSVITRLEIHEQAYNDQMDEVYQWLRCHQFPRDLRRRTRRYFEKYFKLKTHADDAKMLNALTPDLRSHLCEFLVIAEVRNLPIFTDMPRGVHTRLVKILQAMKVEPFEVIVQRGEVASSMFVITEGKVLVLSGQGSDIDFEGCENHAMEEIQESIKNAEQQRMLEAGDSFGEEVLAKPAGLYTYTAITQTPVALEMLPASAFHREFKHFPEVMEQVRINMETLAKQGFYREMMTMTPPPNFEDTVTNALKDLQAFKDQVQQRIQKYDGHDSGISNPEAVMPVLRPPKNETWLEAHLDEGDLRVREFFLKLLGEDVRHVDPLEDHPLDQSTVEL